jgi:quercetin dioxygenase-like cupin family protein
MPRTENRSRAWTHKENCNMLSTLTASRSPLKAVLALGLLASAAAISAPAFAGECPADQVMEGALTSGETKPVGVTDDVLSAIDLSSKGDAFKGQMLRLRKLVVQPGGVVPWHSHEARPANITILQGSITEYRSDCKVPIVHKAGDTIAEFGSFSHWWKNTTKKPAVLYSADLLPPAADDHMM